MCRYCKYIYSIYTFLIVDSVLVKLKRIQGTIIPYDYNYYLSISIYSKLRLYENDVKILHTSKQPGIHTISNLISRNARKVGNEVGGLDIPDGFFIFRSLDDSLTTYLRLGIAMDPTIRIGEVTYSVTSVSKPMEVQWDKEEVGFKSLSPVIVRNFSKRKLYINNEESVEENLNLVTLKSLHEYYGISEGNLKNFKIQISTVRKKTVRISNSKNKESITTAFQLSGKIIGPPEVLKVLYFKGLGSKTSLGLGCWEVV